MSSLKAHTDAELVRECLSGNQRAFETLVRKYEKPIYNVALRILKDPDDAMDISQTVFVKAYEKLESFDEKREFFSWIYRIAINESINASKKTRRQDEYESGVTAALPPTQEEQRNAEILSEEIERAIEVLTLDYRMVIVLRHFHDFSYQEIAEILDIPEKTVKSRLFTARQQLKDVLTARGVTR
ncbi:MAG: sigma-70 family RNA polymerase sigma factor [Candidatus Krumholzibacteria bacterium]|nr:sigma-70 family RNA polymerase sigma factor [Candidatus Krumholzibacteria bacterium]MDH4335841.1 sigma-70 family RNA polymerase sigma factor [Candidatus Krumholzibacteria bacterium]MDH5269367.1 sigma-70 family RNA polymerase sigma factor [Candidatus Krumholzibacteria bacterium]